MNDMTPRRKAINVSLDEDLVLQARALGLNISRACEAGLAHDTKLARGAAFKRDFAATAAYWHDYLAENGMPFADLRDG